MKIETFFLGALLSTALLTGCNQTPPQATTTPAATATSVAQTLEATDAPAESATPGGEQSFEKTLELQEHTFLVGGAAMK